MKTAIKRLVGPHRIKRIREMLGYYRVPDSVIDAAVRTYRRYLDEGRLPSEHPRVIHLETRSLCNGRCHFCAAAITNPGRPADSIMPDALIDNILAEISKIGYANRLSVYNNNEPFLDKRIFDIVARARRALPRAFLEIKTNGLVLTADHVDRIFDAGLDRLHVNDYVADGRPSQRLTALRNGLRRREREDRPGTRGPLTERILISTRQVDEVLSTRAGTAPNRQALTAPLRLPCFRPFEMMAINPAGAVAVCSSDLYFRNPMGNVNRQSLMEIWHSPRWRGIRERLLEGDRAAYPETCAGCDTHNPKVELLQIAGVPVPRPLVTRFERLLTGREVSTVVRD